MRQCSGWIGLAAGLMALFLAFGTDMPCAWAEDWPAETVNDAEGRTYKQVQTRDGGVEVWQFIGVFGSPDEALELVGLSETGGKKGKESIGEIPYEYDLKKVAEKKEQNSVQTLKDGESMLLGPRSGEDARILLKAEDDMTYIVGPESILQDPKNDDPALFGESLRSPEQAGAEENVYEAEAGTETKLSPGESMNLRFSRSDGTEVKVEIKRSGNETYVIPKTVRKAGKKAAWVKARKPKTVSKPESGTPGEKPETVTMEEGKPKAENSTETEDSRQKKKKARWYRQHRPRKIQNMVPVEQINWAFNQIYIQENRASGR